MRTSLLPLHRIHLRSPLLTRLSCPECHRRIDLTLTEFWLVHCVARFPGHVKNREQLMKEAHIVVDDSTITSHVKRVRRKFQAVDPAFEAIDTLAGVQKTVPIRVDASLIARMDREQAEQRKLQARRQLMKNVTRSPAVQAIRKVVRPLMTPFAPLLARASRGRTRSSEACCCRRKACCPWGSMRPRPKR